MSWCRTGRILSAFIIFSLIAMAAITLVGITGCRGLIPVPAPTPTPTPTPGGNAPTVSFSSSALNIAAGDTITLSWATTKATSVTIAPDLGIGALPVNGSGTAKPMQTTSFMITAVGPGGTATQSLTVNVAQAVTPTVTISANPQTIVAGQISGITWQSTNGTSLTITPPLVQEDQTTLPLSSGNPYPVTPHQTTTYTATVVGPGGTASASVTITVTPMQINFAGRPGTIAAGQSATLSWSTAGVTSLVIDNGVGDVSAKLPAGSITVSPTTTTTYTATATGPGGTVSEKTVISVSVLPPPGTSPIKHIVFMIQENRSFDNYFGRLGAYRAARVAGAVPSDVDGFDPNVVLKTDTGKSIKPYHQATECTEGLSPAWDESHYDADIQSSSPSDPYLDPDFSKDTFLMDHFAQTTRSVVASHDPDGTRPMGYYDETDLPFYYEAATQFATSDRFFSSLLANTNPNRMYLFTASSFGHAFPDAPPQGGWIQKTIFRALNDAGVSWVYYYQDDSAYLPQFADYSDPTIANKLKNIKDYYAILASATADKDLPKVVFIERAGSSELDEHPGNNIQKGAATVETVVRALLASAAWQSSAFILSYDEGGGLYDHVRPFQVPPPDNIPPILAAKNTKGAFNLSGFRIPLIVFSPWVKPHFVSHKPRELTSILKFIESTFTVPPLTNRDAAADDMSEFFDFTAPPAWSVPPILPAQTIAPTAQCDYSKEAGPAF